MTRLIPLLHRSLEFGHNIGIHRWIGRLRPYAGRRWFPLLAGAMAAGATLSMTVPVGPMLIALVALHPPRWRAVAAGAAIGSATAGALFTHLLWHFGTAWINDKLPQLAAAKHWHYMVSWVSDYGFITLLGIAASPFTQTPALILAAFLGLPWFKVFGALLFGKAIKYMVLASVTARTTDGVQHALGAALAPEPGPNRYAR